MNARRSPPRVTTSLSWASCLAELGQQRGDLRLEGRAVDRELDRGRGALQAIEVLIEREGPAGVQADHLEDPVAAQKPVIRGRNHGLRGIGYLSIDTGSADA